MKAKFGAIVVNGRGKLGGHVFQQGKAGSVMKTKSSPTNKQTSLQQETRLFLTQLSSSWSSLSVDQRYNWDKNSVLWKKTDVFGNTKTISGFNLYVSCNLNLYRGNLNQIINPLEKEELKSFKTLFVLRTTAPDILYIQLQFNTLEFSTILVYATPVLSNGESLNDKKLVFIGYRYVTTSTIDITSLYNNRFGSLPDHKKFYVAFRVLYPSGMVSSLTSYLVSYP